MATNKMRPIHPGEILREEYLAPLGMSANALAMALHVPAPRVNDIVRERRAVTPDTALRLARYFDTTAQFWLNLQSSFDLNGAANGSVQKHVEDKRQPYSQPNATAERRSHQFAHFLHVQARWSGCLRNSHVHHLAGQVVV